MNDASEIKSSVPAVPVKVGAPMPLPLAPDSIESYYRLARLMAAASILPKHFTHRRERGGSMTPLDERVVIGNLVTCMQFGAEVGLTPAMSIWSIAIVNGVPFMWGDAPLGIVYASNELEYIRETWEGEDQIAKKDSKGAYLPPYGLKAICTVKRKGYQEVTRTFSYAEAELAGLVEKGKSDYSKGTYEAYAKRMLQFRARGFALRDTFPDKMKGIRSLSDQAEILRLIEGEIEDEAPAERPKRADYEKPAQIAAPTEQPMTDPITAAIDAMEKREAAEMAQAKAETKVSEVDAKSESQKPSDDDGKRDTPSEAAGKPVEQAELAGLSGALPEEKGTTTPESGSPESDSWEIVDNDGEIHHLPGPQAAAETLAKFVNRCRTAKAVDGIVESNLAVIGKLGEELEGRLNTLIGLKQDQIKQRDLPKR